MKVSDITVSNVTVNVIGSRQLLVVQDKDVLMPVGMTATDMSGFTELIVGSLTPAISFHQKVRLNNDVLALLTIETIVHECTHLFQERRMGTISYDATYGYQCGLELVKVGVAHIHQDHIMEREARFVGHTISLNFDYSKGYLDIEYEIKKLMGW